MTQVAKIEPEQNAVVTSQTESLLQVISQAASNPNVDVDKMERLMGMYERITAKQAETSFYQAFAEMQPKLPIITKAGKGDRGKWSFAKWEDVVEQITPVTAQFGFSISFKTRQEGDRTVVTCVLAHRDGHRELTDGPPLMVDSSGSKNNVQGVGSTVSYGKRHAAFAALNIVARGEDDDGEAGGARTVSAEEYLTLRDRIEEVGADETRFLKAYGIHDLQVFPAARFKAAMAQLDLKAKQNG